MLFSCVVSFFFSFAYDIVNVISLHGVENLKILIPWHPQCLWSNALGGLYPPKTIKLTKATTYLSHFYLPSLFSFLQTPHISCSSFTFFYFFQQYFLSVISGTHVRTLNEGSYCIILIK